MSGELENAIERAVLLAEGQPQIQLADLPAEVQGGGAPSAGGDGLTLAEVEKRHILATLARCDGNRKRTAAMLGIGPNTLWRKLKSYEAGASPWLDYRLMPAARKKRPGSKKYADC